ncbi:MAG TPA: 2-oxo acid dehydrogenase subunit E2, partial [Streptosporangiaceae bacterium]|nr:2-oxo acid dehydrogenase subunit E2 [Streptosporangiaceae bacterium]
GAEPGPGYEPAGQPAEAGQAGYAAESVFTPVPPAEQPPPAAPQAEQPAPAAPPAEQAPPAAPAAEPAQAEQALPAEQAPPQPAEQPAAEAPLAPPAEAAPPAPPPQEPAAPAAAAPAAPPAAPAATAPPPPSPEPAPSGAPQPAVPTMLTTADGPYVTPLVRKLATEHGVNLAAVTGTGVGGRIRKQDVLEAARAARGSAPAAAAPAAAPAAAAPAAAAPAAAAPPATAPPATAAPATAAPAPAGAAAPPTAASSARAVVPSSLRGTTERMSRARQVIARRMVESLQTSAQLTTVVEADVTEIARLRERAKADFEAREGVKLSFLPFFALATVEALKVHPKLNAIIDTEAGQVTYHDAEHLGIAVDTERGLMVPVIQNAGDLNIGGLARKIADLAARTRSGQVSPDDLAGGTFTLTNTGSRKALFDTPIINQPQVGILGTGAVVKRPVVVEDPALGEVITVRSMVYLALTYDHRLVDGADAARFLATVKDRLEEGEFEAELGL